MCCGRFDDNRYERVNDRKKGVFTTGESAFKRILLSKVLTTMCVRVHVICIEKRVHGATEFKVQAVATSVVGVVEAAALRSLIGRSRLCLKNGYIGMMMSS